MDTLARLQASTHDAEALTALHAARTLRLSLPVVVLARVRAAGWQALQYLRMSILQRSDHGLSQAWGAAQPNAAAAHAGAQRSSGLAPLSALTSLQAERENVHPLKHFCCSIGKDAAAA